MKKTVSSLLFAGLILVGGNPVVAQTSAGDPSLSFPNKAVRIINPFGAGGPTDFLGRLVGEQLGQKWKQPVVVENKLGAGGNIAMEYVMQSPHDGYTLVLPTTGPLAINQFMFKNQRYDPQKDFAPISLMARIDNVLVVHPSVPATNLRELIDYAKKNPGKLTFGSPGVGNQPHLAGEMFKLDTGIDILHIPYKGTSDAMTALVGGQILMLFAQVNATAPFIENGRVRAIGVAATKRSQRLADVPTLAEQGLKFESASIYGLMAPQGTSDAIVQKISRDVQGILKDPKVAQQITSQGIDIVASDAQYLATFMKSEAARYGKIIKDNNIAPN